MSRGVSSTQALKSVRREAHAIKPGFSDAANDLACAIVAAGASALLDNADGVEMRLVEVGARCLPMAVCASGCKRASCLSPIQHYLSYPTEEIGKRSRLWRAERLKTVLWPLHVVMHLGAADRVVYPNHWMTVSRPQLGLDRQELVGLVSKLVQTHPGHAIVFSNVIPAVSRSTYDDLVNAGFLMIPSRRVWIFDPRRPMNGKAFRNIRTRLNKEYRLLEEARPFRISGRDALLPHAPRMAELFNALYVRKHSRLNPQYKPAFFRIMLESELIQSTGWYGPDGALEAFAMHMVSQDIVWSVSGYDPRMSKERRLTRRISTHHISNAKTIGGLFHWGGGADQYKHGRGAIPVQEFDAVYEAHLPYRCRLSWRLLGCFRRLRAPLELNWVKERGHGGGSLGMVLREYFIN